MSGTIYSWHGDVGADVTSQGQDWVLIYDTSTGRTKKTRLSNVFGGGTAAGVVGFYGATAVDQGTMTVAGVTALATAVISAANSATVYGFSSSTVAIAYAKRASQIQADLKTLMQKFESTGLLSIAGV